MSVVGAISTASRRLERCQPRFRSCKIKVGNSEKDFSASLKQSNISKMLSNCWSTNSYTVKHKTTIYLTERSILHTFFRGTFQYKPSKSLFKMIIRVLYCLFKPTTYLLNLAITNYWIIAATVSSNRSYRFLLNSTVIANVMIRAYFCTERQLRKIFTLH